MELTRHLKQVWHKLCGIGHGQTCEGAQPLTGVPWPRGGNTSLLDSRRGAGWHLGCSHLPATCLISGPGGIHREVSPTAQSPIQRTEGVSGQRLQPLPTWNEKPKGSAAFGWGGQGQ